MNIIFTQDAPAPIGPYSQAVEANGFLFASGQIPVDPQSGLPVEGDITAQAERCCRSCEAILKAAGLDFGSVVKTTCYLADMNDFAAFNAVYARYFVSNPARSCVAVRELPKGVRCEIELIAAKA